MNDYLHEDSNISIPLEQQNPLSDHKHRRCQDNSPAHQNMNSAISMDELLDDKDIGELRKSIGNFKYADVQQEPQTFKNKLKNHKFDPNTAELLNTPTVETIDPPEPAAAPNPINITKHTTELLSFTQQADIGAKVYLDKLNQYIKSDKDFEMKFKCTIQQVKESILDFITDDHGLIDYMLELYDSLCVPFRSRMAFVDGLVSFMSCESM